MNRKPTFIRRALRACKIVAIAVLVIADGFVAHAQQTNRTGQADFSNFQVISERNIFNPTRTARHRGGGRAQPVADAFSLVGTMKYAKGSFAFFDGTTSEYRKALPNAGTIAGYKVTDITPTSVKLTAGDKQLTMKIGTQMRREARGAWQLVASSELPAATTETVDSASAEPAGDDSSAEGNDVLKRLMQRREQELQ
jgi:hypothetical protein